jgi:hypothetical protein
MRRNNRAAWIGLAAVASLAQCGDEESTEYCTAEALTSALAGARPGDTVKVGACAITGSFTVPAGVTLAGRGSGTSTLTTDRPQPAVRLTAGTPAARVVDLRIVSAGNSGILVRGTGTAGLERVAVEASRGMAVAAEDVASLELRDVTITGTVVPGNVNTVRCLPDPAHPDVACVVDSDEWPTHGLVLVRVASATLTGVRVTGLAGSGVVLVDSTTAWTGGGAPANLGTGLWIAGGETELTDLDLSGSMQGLMLMPAYGGVFSDDAVVESSGLVVSGGDNYGLLHDSVAARHVDLVARENGDAAVWVQNCDASFELSGAGTLLSGNQFAGVVAVGSSNVTVADARIDGTGLATRIFEEGPVLVGDGVQIVDSTSGLNLRDLYLSGNDRVGLLLDGGGADMAGAVLDGITADGTGTQLGVVAQDGDTPAGWDSGVTRLGSTAANDAALRETLSIAGTVAAESLPRATGLRTDGLNGVIDPDPPY